MVLEISYPEPKRLTVRCPRVFDLFNSMVVVFDVKNTTWLVTCLVGYSFKYLRLENVQGWTGKKFTAISHATKQNCFP